MNRRGLFNEVWLVIILVIVLFSIIVMFWGSSILMPIVVGESQTLVSSIRGNINILSPNTAIANATNAAANTAEGFIGVVETVLYLVFLGFLVGFFACAYYVRTYKWLAVFWILLIIPAVVISMFLSNAYYTASTSSGDLQQFYYTWGTNDFLMLNLPVIVGILGIISGIILFTVSASSDETSEEIL